jgi:hypothetical protein
MKNIRYVSSCLIVLFTGIIYFAVQAQQKSNNHRVNFSGKWKSKESISIGGNIFCAYEGRDRMNSKTMKITEQADFLSIDIPNPSPGAPIVKSQEKLAFSGKESNIDYGQGRDKQFTVKLSADRQTMTVNSISHQRKVVHYVTEVWKLSKDGKSISVQSKAKSNVWNEERSWNTTFDKVN